MTNNQRIEQLKMLNKRRNFENQVRSCIPKIGELTFASLEDTKKLQTYAYQQIDEAATVTRLPKDMETTVQLVSDQVISHFKKKKPESKIAVFHSLTAEIGALILENNDLVTHFIIISEIIGFTEEKRDLICISENCAIGLCTEFLEYENLLVTWD